MSETKESIRRTFDAQVHAAEDRYYTALGAAKETFDASTMLAQKTFEQTVETVNAKFAAECEAAMSARHASFIELLRSNNGN